MRELDREIMEVFGLKQNAAMDARIQEVLNTLHTMETITGDTVSGLFDTVCLSQSRLSHLFKQETGIPLSRYLALVKMRKGFEYFQEYGSITEAAVYFLMERYSGEFGSGRKKGDCYETI